VNGKIGGMKGLGCKRLKKDKLKENVDINKPLSSRFSVASLERQNLITTKYR